MTPERWDEIQALFVEVVDLEPAERKSRLAVISGTDPELYSEVLSLLEAHAQADDLLDELDELPSPGGLAEAEALLTPQLSDPYGLVGRTVSHYRVLEPLGGGGMGVLYKAVDRQLDRTGALKFLPPQWSLDAGFKERFAREARAAAALDHPNVCTIYEAGETQEGQLFIAMALYEGYALTLHTDFEGGVGHNPGRIQYFLDVAGTEMDGTWSWDHISPFGTVALTRP